MKHLILLRHGDAEKSRPGLADVDRPLSARGREEALDAAQCLRGAGLRIDTLLISPAVRARETAVIVAAQLDLVDGFRYEPALYLGAPDALLSPLRRCEPTLQTVLMVGHNPGLSEFARRCNGSEQDLELRTAELYRVDFEGESWQELQLEAATCCAVLR